MVDINMIVVEPISLQYYQADWYTNVVEPLALVELLNNVALRYSEMLLNLVVIRGMVARWDGTRTDVLNSAVLDLPGARIPTTNAAFPQISSCLYYQTYTPDKVPYRRRLIFCHYLEDVVDGQITTALYDYLCDRLTSFYDNSDYSLYSWNYKKLSFHKLNPKVQHYNAFRYPRRYLRQIWLH
jgi:hypothetical protein